MAQRLPQLQTHAWNNLIIDEAQAIKNPGTQLSQTVKAMHAQARFALTGTPIENGLWDLWSIADFTCPSLLGTKQQFQSLISSMDAEKSYRPLRKLLQLFLLRRKKDDKKIIRDLPAKHEAQLVCALSPKQKKVYIETLKGLQAELKKKPDQKQRGGLILSYLTKTKQICNHPSQLLKDNQYYEGDSGKFGVLREVACTVAAKGEKLLVFTQFREMVDILNDYLTTAFGKSGGMIHGGLSVKHRETVIQRFREDVNTPFLVLSLRAAGTGLNLTCANHVVHFDRWWNPAVENQATDRAFRIGQTRG